MDKEEAIDTLEQIAIKVELPRQEWMFEGLEEVIDWLKKE